MTAKWANDPFGVELPRLLQARGMSLRRLAKQVGVSDSHLSRVVRGVNYKSPSLELMAKIAQALDLPPDYFVENREAYVVSRVKSDARLRDSLYRRLRRR